MHKNKGAVYYHDYLKLEQLLSCQEPLSRRFADQNNKEAHDEMLFITVHQSYEIWFKQILHEINSIILQFKKSSVPDSAFGQISNQLNRITKIQTMMLSYLEILETMTPMDFLEFRNLLIPASGFQSTQFRELEIKLGLKTSDRENVDKEFFLGRLTQKDRDLLIALESETSLLDLIHEWLERMPYSNQNQFNFWEKYREKINLMLKDDEETILKNSAGLLPENIQGQLENLKVTRNTFDSLFEIDLHSELIQQKKRKFSQKAILNALFILLYRDEPMMTLPQKTLSLLMDIDENFTTWRYRHALLAQRMLGTKIGTGGSSGHQYLKKAADNNRTFMDLFNLSTYLIPRSALPELPSEVRKKLNFN